MHQPRLIDLSKMQPLGCESHVGERIARIFTERIQLKNRNFSRKTISQGSI